MRPVPPQFNGHNKLFLAIVVRKFKTQNPTQIKPKPEVVTLDDSVMINETGDISVQEVAHEEIVGEELPGMFFLNMYYDK